MRLGTFSRTSVPYYMDNNTNKIMLMIAERSFSISGGRRYAFVPIDSVRFSGTRRDFVGFPEEHGRFFVIFFVHLFLNIRVPNFK